jgi:hypothetical protein
LALTRPSCFNPAQLGTTITIRAVTRATQEEEAPSQA